MEIKDIFFVLFFFVTVVSLTILLGNEFDNKGLLDNSDQELHSNIKNNFQLNYDNKIDEANTNLEEMRNRLQSENKENNFAFQFSQALIWAYDLLEVINSITKIVSTLSFFVGIYNDIILSIARLLDWLINFVLGVAIWRALFR